MPTYIENTCDCSGQDLVVTKNVVNCKNCRSKEPNEIRQKRIWKQVRSSASVYTMNRASLIVASGNDNKNTVAVKHNSYDRYLARKKAGHLLSEVSDVNPSYGNKTRMYGMIANANTNCSICSN